MHFSPLTAIVITCTCSCQNLYNYYHGTTTVCYCLLSLILTLWNLFIVSATVRCVERSIADSARSSSGGRRGTVGQIKEGLFLTIFTIHSQHQDGVATAGTISNYCRLCSLSNLLLRLVAPMLQCYMQSVDKAILKPLSLFSVFLSL